MLARKAFALLFHVHTHLGGYYYLAAAARLFQPIADYGFRLTAHLALRPNAVYIGRINQIKAAIHKLREQFERHGLIYRPAKYVAAKGEWGYGDVGLAEGVVVHGCKCIGYWLKSKLNKNRRYPDAVWKFNFRSIGCMRLCLDKRT